MDPIEQEVEIDLREYINAVIKRRRIVLAVFLGATIITAISSFLMPRGYQATAMIMITPSRLQTTLSPTDVGLDVGIKAIDDKYSNRKSAISIPTHKLLLNTNVVLERVIDKLDLTNPSGRKMSLANLSKNLNIRESMDTKETNILQLETENKNPDLAKDIANTWAQEYIQYNQELISGEVKGTGDFINDQFSIAKQNLVKAEGDIKDFKDKYKIDLMQAELDMKKAKLNDYKKELLDIEIALKTKEDSLKELKKGIEKQEKFIVVSKAITDDALWQQEGKKSASSDLNRKGLRSEIVNPIYQDIESRIVNTGIELNTLKPRIDYLKSSVLSTGKEINELEKNVNQRNFDLTQLTRQAQLYKTTYDSLSTKMEEARIVKAAQLGEVRLVSPAIRPERPVSIGKLKNIIVSGITSFLFGIFLVFFIEFWQKGKEGKAK